MDVVKGNQSTSAVKGVIQGKEISRWWEIGELVRRVQKEATKKHTRGMSMAAISIEVKNPDSLTFRAAHPAVRAVCVPVT